MPAPQPDSPADLVLVRGRPFTVDHGWGTPGALVVHAGRITAVGPEADVRPFIGPRSRVVDLRGRTILPGFQDAHVHALSSGLERMRCELYDLDGVPAYLDAVATYAAAHPAEPWIRGGGWSLGDSPAAFRTGHCSTVSSRIDRPS